MGFVIIGTELQNLWNAWNIRGIMILSLCVQILLAYGAPLRRQASRTITVVVVWSAYLIADWAAVYAFGLISNTARNDSTYEVHQDILALWSAFLLVHLGGPDTITAYSLEDNALWLRHIVGLVAQLAVFCYVFLKTFPENNLVAPTALVLASGVVKYGERSRALFLASLENLKSSIDEERERTEWFLAKQSRLRSSLIQQVKIHIPADEAAPAPSLHQVPNDRSPTADTTYNRSTTMRDFRQLVLEQRLANFFFQTFKGLVVDIILTRSEIQRSRDFFLQVDADKALQVISRELNLMYQVLYTKIMAIYSSWGIIGRAIFDISMITALVLFCLAKKDRFDRVDVRITYALFVGVFVVGTSRKWLLVESDWSSTRPGRLGVCSISLEWIFLPLDIIPLIVGTFLFRCCFCVADNLWSETMGAFNLLVSCLLKHSPNKCCWNHVFDYIVGKCGLTERIDRMKYTRRHDLDEDLWKFIFDQIRGKALMIDDEEKTREAYESKGEWVLKQWNCDELMHYTKDFEYDKMLLTWHVATEMCYAIDTDETDTNRRFSNLLSDYVMYLLVQRRKMMSTIVGKGYLRYTDTCREVKELVEQSRAENLKEFYREVVEEQTQVENRGDFLESTLDDMQNMFEMVLDNKRKRGKGDRGRSVLPDACKLTRALMSVDNKWEIMTRVWVEILSYTASHCRADEHARVLSEGGELVTHVWLLMSHFGIGPRWPKQED